MAQNRDSWKKTVEQARNLYVVALYKKKKYLKMPNRITFGPTTVIRVYGIMRACILKATDLLSIKLFHTRVTYTEIVSM